MRFVTSSLSYTRLFALGGLLMLVAAFGSAGARPAQASPDPTMRIDPASVLSQSPPGSPFAVDVRIEGITGMSGFQFQLSYDDARASYVSATAGAFLGGQFQCIANPLPGLLQFSCVEQFPSGVSGSGVIAHVTLSNDQKPGVTSNLLLIGCQVTDADGNPIAINGCKDGSFTVGGIASLDPLALNPAAAGGLAAGGGMLAAAAAGALGLGVVGWQARRRLTGVR